MKLEIVETIYETNARSIVDMLRETANSLEAETDDHDRTKAMIAVQVTKSGEVLVYGWGDTNQIEAIGSMTMALHEMCQGRMERE
jgi:HJR/Mrr/RecB family endonuclease